MMATLVSRVGIGMENNMRHHLKLEPSDEVSPWMMESISDHFHHHHHHHHPPLILLVFHHAALLIQVLVLGGDGFCGWPTSLYLSEKVYDVIIADRLRRRNIDNELGYSSLTPIELPDVRMKAWKESTGKEIKFINLDVAKEYDVLVQVREEEVVW